MRWFSPTSVRACVVTSCLIGLISAGCGRLGFDPLSKDFRGVTPVDEPGGASHDDSDDVPSGDAGSASTADASSPNADGADGGVDASEPNGTGTPAADDCSLVADALACSNFEQGLPADMVVETSDDGSVSLDDGYLDATTSAADGWARIRASFPAVTSGSIYMRMSLYVPSAAQLSLVNFADLMEQAVDSSCIDFNLEDDDVEVYFHQTDDAFLCSGCAAARDAWFCFRTRVDLGDGDGRVRTWIDGVLLQDLQGVDTLSDGGMQEASFGLVWVDSAQSSARLLLDDIAISTSPLSGCP